MDLVALTSAHFPEKTQILEILEPHAIFDCDLHLFLEIESLVLPRNALKRSVLMVGFFWRKFFLGKNLVWPKMA